MNVEQFEKKLKEFMGSKVTYYDAGQMIFGKTEKAGDQLILDVRGWGAIQHLFKEEKEAAEFQDAFGEWIAESINDKLEAYNTHVSKMPTMEEAQKQVVKMCINEDQGEGFGMCFRWLISLANPTKKP